MKHDNLYQKPIDTVTGFTFNQQVVEVFPDMIQRSVPGYSTIISMTGVIASRYATADSTIYDLGCSLGASLYSIAEHMQNDCPVDIIGIDNSQSMIDRCQVSLDTNLKVKSRSISLHCQNIEATSISNASVVVLNFSLQFIPLTERNKIINNIYAGMNEGGILILSEKIHFDDEHLNQLNIELHHKFKKNNGYSNLEVSQKRDSLENVLIPETLKTHQARLKNSGFTRCDVWFQCFNFASLVAIK